MKEKRLITISLLSLLLFSVGCSRIDLKKENNLTKMAKNDVTIDVNSTYRERLALLKKFKSRISMPFIYNGGYSNGLCDKEEKYNSRTRELCFDLEVPAEETCEDSFGKRVTMVVERITENNQTIKTTYKCINTTKEGEKLKKHYFLKDHKYISVSNIINKSGKKDLPTNLDLVVKNTLNRIGKNYTLVEAKGIPQKNEYRIEGAITGLDSIYNRNDNKGGQLYQTGGARVNLEANQNSNMDVKELSMDFIIKKYDSDMKKWIYIKNISTSKKIIVSKTTDGDNFVFALIGAGVKLGNLISKSNGISHVSRALIESSLIELLAKLDDLPYWSFLPNSLNYYTTEEENWKNELLAEYRIKLKNGNIGEYYKKEFPEQLLKNYYGDITQIIKYYDEHLYKYNGTISESNLTKLIKTYKFEFKEDKTFIVGLRDGIVDEELLVHLLETVPNKLVEEKVHQNKPKIQGKFKSKIKGVKK